jgi:hypothetical protein
MARPLTPIRLFLTPKNTSILKDIQSGHPAFYRQLFRQQFALSRERWRMAPEAQVGDATAHT